MQDRIWSPETVAQLAAYQLNDMAHGYTCVHKDDGRHGNGLLVPTVRGFICPFCDYTQKFALLPATVEETELGRFLRAQKAQPRPVVVVRSPEYGVEAYEVKDGDAETRICYDILRRYDRSHLFDSYRQKAVLRFDAVDELLRGAYGSDYADIICTRPSPMGMYPEGA
jgi:hypothetical protein